MKVAIINDTHAGIRNSSDIFLDNAEKFYSDVFFPYLLENGIRRIIHLGDVFDNRKFINFRALNRFRKSFLTKLREHGIHMHVLPGNHDTFYKNTNELNSLKELLGHYMGEVTIHMEPTVIDLGGMKFGLVPWICQENEVKCMHFLQNAKCDILGGHFEIAGFDMMRGVKNEHGMNSSVFSRYEMVLSGHFHTKSTQDNIHYLGSQMEFTWSDAHDPKHFHVIDTDTRELTAIRNPHTLFERIHYDDSKHDYLHYNLDGVDDKFVKVVVINKTDSFAFDRFIDRLQNRQLHELKIAENFSEFLGDNVDDEEVSVDDTSVLLDSYIDAVDTDLDKDRIKREMHELMTEAQVLEIV
jgi:DNA repair exonuclease SbcCD nuclease subunit